eukprot:TRINITY_DN14657_c0_g1_i1.p2 TRINITY_DN14657_c0_g1~~TRINITY_DN14657_c0_g1_i1.p2  ORF type:complete len:203 (-),score=34.29 TRINITY_DN14657_c0_g1_i1:13-621(-)
MEEHVVLLVDDVLFTGRTIRSALEAILDYGRPRCVELLTLVDRGNRELPIQPDYVGLRVDTKPADHVDVHLHERDGQDQVTLVVTQGSFSFFSCRGSRVTCKGHRGGKIFGVKPPSPAPSNPSDASFSVSSSRLPDLLTSPGLRWIIFGAFWFSLSSLLVNVCLLYTSDAADEEDSVGLCGWRYIAKKKHEQATTAGCKMQM